MQLEDHLGDIIRKARNMNNVSAAAAARSAGLTQDELATLEVVGQCTPKINIGALGEILGLNAANLEGIAKGWLPAATDLERWVHLRIFTTAGDGLSVNCFLIWDTATREAAVFDTGIDAQPVLDWIAQNKLELRHIFITHSHWDHVEALPQLRTAFPAAQIHSRIKGAPQAQQLQANKIIPLGGLRVSHVATPGHADDGTTYFITGWPGNPPLVAIVGDTILAGSMCNGNGQWTLARQKIREHILTLPEDTLLCPGHGPVTTVAQEKAHNPFF